MVVCESACVGGRKMSFQFPAQTLPGRADSFAETAHAAVGQRRKYTGEAYINHPRAVASLVLTVTDDDVVLAAALLHDTVEDTETSLEDIEREFGPDVALLVENLTDISRPEDGNRRVRKEFDRQHTAKADPRAKTIKLADLIDNTRLIVANDPAFARVYLTEKARLLEVLSDGHPDLYQLATETLLRAQETLATQSVSGARPRRR